MDSSLLTQILSEEFFSLAEIVSERSEKVSSRNYIAYAMFCAKDVVDHTYMSGKSPQWVKFVDGSMILRMDGRINLYINLWFFNQFPGNTSIAWKKP